MKFCWLDNWYDGAWKAWQQTGGPPLHGTMDAWDIALRAAGHESDTYIANSCQNVRQWVEDRNPDVLCVQSVGRWPPQSLGWFSGRKVAFCSYAASDADMTGWSVVFTSFQWLVDHLSGLGQKAVYLPLAFGKAVLDRVEPPAERDLPITFVGGMGHRIWKQGTETMTAVAEAFPDDFHWYGYRAGPIPEPLEKCYRGEAWGADYWTVLMRSRVTINRHGEISRHECPQNMREYEAAGTGTFLLSDVGVSLPGRRLYRDSSDLIWRLGELLRTGTGWVQESEGKSAQELALQHHTYEHRVPVFLEAIESL